MKVIIDTNFLMIPAMFKVDIFTQLDNLAPKVELCIVDKTIDELSNIIENQSSKHKSAAKLALQLVKAKNPKILRTKTNKEKQYTPTDDIILEQAIELKAAVATQDAELKRRLKDNHVPRIVLRQKRYLKLVE